jgi:hypothetical protein
MGRLLVGMLLLLLIADCSDAVGDDLIVLQDGSHRIGTLQGCLNGGCQLNGRAIPQATIAWIGLHQARSNPPQPNDPAVAEIRMIDHAVHPGLMTAIDPTRVITAPGSYDRQKVAWVYLAHAAKAARDAPVTGSRVVRFDVYVAVTIHQHFQEHFGAGLSVEDDSADWTGSWQNVTLRIVPGPHGAPYASIIPDLPYPTGVVQASAQFTYNDPPTRYQPTNCKGELPTQTYTGVFVLNYPRQANAREDFVIAQAQDVGNKFFDALGAVIKSRCGEGYFSVSGSPAAYHYFHLGTPDGMGFEPLYLSLNLSWDRASGSASEMPFPLDEILAGKSVTLETGTQSRFYGIVGGVPGDGATVDEAVRVSFTAR